MFNPFTELTSKIYGAAAIVAVVVAGAQTLRIEGAFCRDTAAGEYSRCLVTGFEQKVADRELKIDELTVRVFAEQAAHRQTKLDYRAAQARAAELEAARIARVEAEQQEITDEVTADYRRRLADARAAAERLRGELARAGEHPAGAGGAEHLPEAGAAPGRAGEAAADPRLPFGPAELDWRLVATEQALQLNALIDWVERQAAIDVNAEGGAP